MLCLNAKTGAVLHMKSEASTFETGGHCQEIGWGATAVGG